ncbi:DUF1349 domain-containing protein [Arthrobacter sp. G.S.26]|uniref:DUF1349 domain-containing protein n=1 Tax=Arthrobacter sp. G.S.26 TaxID=3433706 RepID=UPI003D772EB1
MPIRSLAVPGLPFPLETAGAAAPVAPVVVGGEVRLTAAPGADLFLDPKGASDPRPDAERWTAPVEGDFQLQAHVAAGFATDFDSGVLLGWFDDDTWFKACAERDPSGMTRVVSVVTRDGASDDCDSWPIDSTGTYLRISRFGAAFALHASTDAQNWNMVRYFRLGRPASEPVRVGFVAQSPAGQGTWATFRDIRFSRSTLGAVRDGS